MYERGKAIITDGDIWRIVSVSRRPENIVLEKYLSLFLAVETMKSILESESIVLPRVRPDVFALLMRKLASGAIYRIGGFERDTAMVYSRKQALQYIWPRRKNAEAWIILERLM